LGSVGETCVRRVVNATRKKGDNGRRAIREFRSIKGLAAVRLVTIISIVEPKSGRSQRTGAFSTSISFWAAAGRPGNAG